MSIPESVIEAASIRRVEKHGFDEARARRVILALASDLPESAVEKAAMELHDRVVVGGDGYVAATDDVKSYWRGYAQAAIIAALKDIAGEMP